MTMMKELASAVATGEPGDEALHAAVRCIVDWSGCALAGADHPAVSAVAEATSVLGRGDDCTVVGRQGRASQYGAALINGTASHVLDFDDVNVVMIGHPAVVVVPAALAAAEALGAEADRLLRGVVAGYAVAAALGATVNPVHYERGWHATATLGCAAAAAAVCRILDADTDTTARALSIALTQAGGVRAMFGTHGKSFHAGRAAAAGLLSANLARAGLDVPDDVLEGPAGYRQASGSADPVPPSSEEATSPSPSSSPSSEEAPSDRSPLAAILSTAFKGHAACGATHCAIDAVAALVAEHGIEPTEVAAIDVDVHRIAVKAAGIENPTTGLEAKFSLSHVAAQAVTAYPLLPGQFTADAVNDPVVVGLRRHVRISVDETFRYDQAMPARVRLTTAAGRTYTRFVDVPRGRPANPMTDGELGAKFLALAGPVVGPDRAQAALDGLWELPSASSVTGAVSGLAR